MKTSNRKLANPFIYQGYRKSSSISATREAENKDLDVALKNGRNQG